MKHWIFDLDNTLINSFPLYSRILTEVTAHYGVLLSVEDQKHIQHLALPKFLERVLDNHQVEPAFQKTIELSMARHSEIQPFEGIVELLTLLKSKGCTLSIFTARELVTARAVLNTTGLDHFFEQLVTRDCVAHSKPSPEGINKILNSIQSSKVHALMVGDHQMDIEAARAAGIKAVSVCWDRADSELTTFSDHHFTTVLDLHLWAAKNLSK